MPTVVGKSAYSALSAQIGRLKSTIAKRQKRVVGLEKKLKGMKVVDMRAERRKRTKTRKRR